MNDTNGSGGSAVVVASRDAKDVMRKLVDMEKIFAKFCSIRVSKEI